MSLALFILSTLVVKVDVGLILACFFIFGLGNGLFQSPNNSEVMSSLPMEKSGTASSVIATVRNLGMALGASFGSILLSFSLISQGFSGPVLDASPLVLAEAISKVLLAGGLISFIGFIISLLRR
jgi:fucose permease